MKYATLRNVVKNVNVREPQACLVDVEEQVDRRYMEGNQTRGKVSGMVRESCEGPFGISVWWIAMLSGTQH